MTSVPLPPPVLLIATSNQGKMRELRALLSELDVELLTPHDLHLHLQVEEDGSTYDENAFKKAVAYARASGLLTLADDSGLEVDVLAGAPGIYSARYAPQPGATDADRRAYLLQNLRQHPRPWHARFVAAVAVATPEGVVHWKRGECRGEIIPQARGAHGFGYDPIFYIAQLKKTMAELDMQTKNRISHRANAVRAIIPLLRQILRL